MSLLACALIFTGRRTTPDADRPWFFRLAAAAAQAYRQRLPGGPTAGGTWS